MKTHTNPRPQPGSGKPVECQTCGKRFVDKRSLKQHATMHETPRPRVGQGSS